MEDTVTEEYADNQAARGGRNRRRGMTTFRVKTVGWLFVLLATIGTTILPSMLGYQPGSDDMVAMTVLVICEVVSWTAVPLYAWLLVQGYRHTHSVVQYGIRLLALAIIAALALFVIKTQSGDAKGDKQPAQTEQHNNNAPLRTIKHK